MPSPLSKDSLEARVDAVRRSIWSRNDKVSDEAVSWMILDIYDDFAVVRQGRDLLKVPYAFDANGVAVLSEPEEVTLELVPVKASMVGDAVLVAAEGEKEGWTWEVVVIEPGRALHNDYYPAEVLAAAVELFADCKVYAFPETRLSHHKNPLDKKWDRQVAWLENPRIGEHGEIRATMHFLRTPAGTLAERTRKALVAGWERNDAHLLGLSIDARGTVIPVQTDAGAGRLIASITEVLSTDIVVNPAAGGKLTQLVASATATEEEPMDPQIKRLWDLLQARRPEALHGLDEKTVTAEQLLAAIPDDIALAPVREGEETKKEQPGAQPVQAAADGPNATDIKLTAFLVRDLVQASKLPDLAQKRLRKRFAGLVAEESEIQAAIDAERDYLAELAPARVAGLGGERQGAGIQVGAETIDRLQAAMDRAFGLVPENESLRTIAPLGFRALYAEITAGQDPDVTGILSPTAQQAMLQAAFTNATLPQVVANSMHRRLTRDYRELDYREREIINVVPAADFKQRQVQRIGYFGDLPNVDPETADYAELAAYGEEFENYAVGQKGAVVTITRKHIINDDVGAFAKVAGRLGRSARRTFAKFVWDFVVSNPAMQDANAWASVAHSNLVTTALSLANLTAIRGLLYNQTELTSAEKLGLEPYLLAVPINLEDLAIQINQTDRVPGSANNDANRWYHKFGQNNERIVVVPFFADANDYAVFANPADVDIIEVAFLNGQEEPELWVADMPTVGQMFTADKLQYKIRHEYGGVPVDFRGFVKGVVL